MLFVNKVLGLQFYITLCQSAFSALTLLVEWQEGIRPVKTEWWDDGVVICLGRDADCIYPADATVTHCLLLQ